MKVAQDIKVETELKRKTQTEQKIISLQHIIVKVLTIQKKERILEATKEKEQMAYKDRPIREQHLISFSVVIIIYFLFKIPHTW